MTPPQDPDTDFLWLVSPARQRWIGEGYGLTARESVSLERSLRFLPNRAAYQEALATYAAVSSGQAEGADARLQALARGTLTLDITAFEVGKGPGGADTEAIGWIEFAGEACVPVADL